MKRNNVITASRMNGLMRCPRQSWLGSELGFSRIQVGLALRVGSAWARGTEARWRGATYEEALAAAIPVGVALDELACATVSAMLAAYYDYYGPIETFGHLEPEVQLPFRKLGIGDFVVGGKLDGLGVLKDGRQAILESKSTSDSLDPDSSFWLRLEFNIQLMQYLVESREMGWDVAVIFYDVMRKPSIAPKTVVDIDEQGRKIVVDKNGDRVFTKMTVEEKVGKGKKAKLVKREVDNLEKPRQSASAENGWELKSHIETPDEFCDRLYNDALSRPDFYFKRREVPVLESQATAFKLQRAALAKLILHYRSNESTCRRPQDAWPRNVSSDTCDFCQFKTFCLPDKTINPNQPPDGFQISPHNIELQNEPNQSST